MRDNGRSEDGSNLRAGETWLIEQVAPGSLWAFDRGALNGADVILYDSVLASIIADLLPLGSYAEPRRAEVEQ
jgi:hypothetical protein